MLIEDESGTMHFAAYWGKTVQGAESESNEWHLLPYHCLDVASVASLWWDASTRIRKMMCALVDGSEVKVRAWLLFFIALHDLGKWDVRFQLKVPQVWRQLQSDWDDEKCGEASYDIKKYDHGSQGYMAFCQDFEDVGQDLDAWSYWMCAVTGHHGRLYGAGSGSYIHPEVEERWLQQDKKSRSEWFCELERLFLKPIGLTLQMEPPCLAEKGVYFVAGFCSVVDWIGSQREWFPLSSRWIGTKAYWEKTIRNLKEKDILTACGILQEITAFSGVEALLGAGKKPRQVQCLVEELSLEPGLTIIEAPTGCGKTEAGIGYAWRLLAAGQVDSLIFALPTQATANAMFSRVLELAEILYKKGSNLVLAHGKSLRNHAFLQLCLISADVNLERQDEAQVQCASWLANSKKRAFLGQIGICTIDQVLLSVLPVRHGFVRTLGLGRSVLLIDEVHAYDAYMYGLLKEVLQLQAASGGSAVLLSATLPTKQKQELMAAWGGKQIDALEYPLVTQISHTYDACIYKLPSSQRPLRRIVKARLRDFSEPQEETSLLKEVAQAVQQGTLVGWICNSVTRAQTIAEELRNLVDGKVDVFHSRYMFADRQIKELAVIEQYGLNGKRESGRVLVATQVVEQSLDLDFDWLIAEVCPIDLLFQRIGRLHRHVREHRPVCFSQPRVDVCIPAENDYGITGLIYGDQRLLWRTEELLRRNDGVIEFPEAFRTWVEQVYEETTWGEEPEPVQKSHQEFLSQQAERARQALCLVNTPTVPLDDSNEKVAALTRDGEMQLQVVLIDSQGCLLADGCSLRSLTQKNKEEIIGNSVVPVSGRKSWRSMLPEPEKETGLIYVTMQQVQVEVWEAVNVKNENLYYDRENGLRRDDA